jgi:LemA protein
VEVVLGFVLLLVFVAGVVAFGVVLYNRLVSLRNRVDQAWADVDVQLRRRYDLIPNLVETVKGYAAHERETFEAVTEARARAVAAGGVREQAEAEGMLTQALRSLFAVAEGYPELQASRNFQELQTELAATENRISDARQTYNANVRVYDTARQTVPTNIVANLFSFPDRPYFELDEPGSRDPVDVRF